MLRWTGRSKSSIVREGYEERSNSLAYSLARSLTHPLNWTIQIIGGAY